MHKQILVDNDMTVTEEGFGLKGEEVKKYFLKFICRWNEIDHCIENTQAYFDPRICFHYEEFI